MSTIIGNQDLIFGITDTAALGFFENLEYEEDGEFKEVPRGDGEIIAVILFAEKINVKGTFVIDTTAAMPTRGSELTLTQGIPHAGPTLGDIILKKTTQTVANGDVAKMSFEGVSYPNVVFVP